MDTNEWEALDLSKLRWDEHGLIPAIAQDVDTKEILMLAYMNKESLQRTLKEKKACYFSRSRQTLWLKGETSGHFQEVIDIKLDCDQDTLLLTVKQTGMACHENYFSCFHYDLTDSGIKKIGAPEEKPEIPLGRTLECLAEVIHSRRLEKPEGAYTTYLFEKGIDKILKKVGEENAEVIIAAKNNDPDEIRYEVSDLFYHVLVMLEDRGVSLSEISRELLSRRK